MNVSPPLPPSASVTETAAPPRRSLIRRLFVIAFCGLIAVFAGAMLLLWFPLEGGVAGIAAIPPLVAQSSAMALVLMTLAWLAFFSRQPRLTRGILAGLILVPVVALAASIRDIDFTGDMVMRPVFRWEKPQTQVVDEYRKGQSAAKPRALQLEPTCPWDMPAYRGLHRDGVVVEEFKLREDLKEIPPKPLWMQPVGEGYSSMAVAWDLLVTMEQRSAGEAVVCYHVKDGREIWVYQTDALFDEPQGGPGPRSTPEIDYDRVYALGATGRLHCLETLTGNVLWTHDLLQMTGVQNAQWGMTSSPLVVDDQLVVNIGGPEGNGLLSFDKVTGELRWKTAGLSKGKPETASTASTNERTDSDAGKKAGDVKEDVAATGSALAGYSSPQISTLDKVRQIVNVDGTAVRGHDLQDGHVLWTYDFRNPPGVNVAQPVVLDDGTLIVSASYGLGTMRLKIERKEGSWTVTPLWSNPSYDLKPKMASLVYDGTSLYGLDEGIMVCLDPETGKRTWKGGRYGHGQVLLSGEQLVILTEKGEVVLVKANPKKHEEIARFQALPSDVKTWNPHALARGILYVRNHHWMGAFDLRLKTEGCRP